MDGLYHHVVATKNGAAVHLYIDGVDRTGTVTNATLTATTNPLAIGQNVSGTSPSLDANYDDFAVYNVALGAAQVQRHFSIGTTPGSSRHLRGHRLDTYLLGAADVGSTHPGRVTASNADGTGTATSAQTATVSTRRPRSRP